MLKTMPVAAFLVSLNLAFCVNAFAQNSEKRIKMNELPDAVRRTVQDQSKGATLRSLAKEIENGKTFYEAELRVNGHNKDVLIDPNGGVVEVEEQVPLISLPANVKATIEKAAGKGKILVVESITKNNTLEGYEAHITRAGKKSEIKIAPDGQMIAPAKAKG